MRLLTNNPCKTVGLEGYGLQIMDWVPIESPYHKDHMGDLHTTQETRGHLLK